MGKKQLNQIKPQGRFSFFTLLCDHGGVGHHRTIFPTLVINSSKYKAMQFCGEYGSWFSQDPGFFGQRRFVRFQRSAELSNLQAMKFLKDRISPMLSPQPRIIYEVDDNMFDVPKTNFAYSYYKNREFYIKEMLKLSDGLTVSTQYLKKFYSQYNENISVIPNYLVKAFWNFEKTENHNKKMRILYPGSANHFNQGSPGGDFGSKLIDFIKKTTDKYDWIFIGGIPFELKNNSKIEFYNWQGMLNYQHFLKSLNADIGIAPLEICEFNKAKSDIKMLEYTALGIPGVYQNLEPYYNAFCKANNDDEFISYIEKLENDFDFRKTILENDSKILEKRWMEDNFRYWIDKHLELFGMKLGA